jgi:uncharacterized membrane protein
MTNDEQLDILLGRLLRAGVTAAAVVVMTGAFWFLTRHGRELRDYHAFQPDAANSPALRAVYSGIRAGRSRSLIQAGLLMLIATPVARVALSLVLFIRRKDYVYVCVTSIVMAVLLGGVLAET